MPALMRLYKQNSDGAYGPCERTEAYWRWLVGRKAYDALLVALDGPDKLELEETIAPIVGYAVLRQGRIVELCAAPEHATADYQLLARACADAIEHDRQQIFLHAPPTSRLHQVIASANGRYIDHESDGEEVFMVKVFDPPKFLEMLAPEFDARAKAAGMSRDVELGLSVEGEKWRLVCTRRGFRVRGGSLGRNFLILNRAEFTRLALGHAKVRDTAETGRIIASTKSALDLAETIFPRLAFWRPQWDELPA
jgi:hypothetical protein